MSCTFDKSAVLPASSPVTSTTPAPQAQQVQQQGVQAQQQGVQVSQEEPFYQPVPFAQLALSTLPTEQASTGAAQLATNTLAALAKPLLSPLPQEQLFSIAAPVLQAVQATPAASPASQLLPQLTPVTTTAQILQPLTQLQPAAGQGATAPQPQVQQPTLSAPTIAAAAAPSLLRAARPSENSGLLVQPLANPTLSTLQSAPLAPLASLSSMAAPSAAQAVQQVGAL